MDLDEGLSHDRIFGDGDLPHALNGINWAAFLLGGLWALLHGLWVWFVAILVVRFGLIGLESIARSAGLFDAGVWGQAFSIISGMLSWTLYAVFAFKANDLAWGKARSRLSRRPDEASRSQITLGTYSRNQKTLLLLGVALLVLGMMMTAQSVIQRTAALVPFLASSGIIALVAAITHLVDVARRSQQQSS